MILRKRRKQTNKHYVHDTDNRTMKFDQHKEMCGTSLCAMDQVRHNQTECCYTHSLLTYLHKEPIMMQFSPFAISFQMRALVA